MDINDVVKMVKPPLRVFKDKNKIIHDKSTIVLYCDRGHYHIYLINDIINNHKNNIITKCLTCYSKGKFIKLLRTELESKLNTPFTLTDNILTCFELKTKILIDSTKTSNINQLRKKYPYFEIFSIDPIDSKFASKRYIREQIIKNANDKIRQLFLKGYYFSKDRLPYTLNMAQKNKKTTKSSLIFEDFLHR